MKIIDFVLIAGIAAAVIFAVRAIRRGKGKGCCGDCNSCGAQCNKNCK